MSELVRREISRLLRLREGHPEAFAEIVDDVRLQTCLVPLLHSIANDATLLAGTASRSMWHPNGFVKILLAESPGFRLRLHVWPPSAEAGPELPVQHVHSHRWDFAAAVLSGAYRQQLFRVSGDGDPHHAYEYLRPEDPAYYRFRALGERRLQLEFDALLPVGTVYTQLSPVLHRVVPAFEAPVVTLVLEGPPKPSRVHVYARSELEPQFVTEAQRFRLLSEADVLDSLSAVLALPNFS